MKPIIEARGIGKKYNISHDKGRYIALRDVLANIARKPFSFLGQKVKSAVGIGKKEEFWALKNVDFTIERGEVVGVIGKNGAGKSTLLKILSQITPPTEGEIILRGRVGSLLEVGTGFHPELTGRENIFLNGAILGMSRREIAEKFDKIVEFAGVGKFLDTPVKYYSSGMYVRLAFSVAAHMEPDILLVDEVLAVGDADFQKKCLGKMEEVTRTAGRTILFVSHNMSAIQSLCTRSIVLENGQVSFIGPTSEAIDRHFSSGAIGEAEMFFPEDKGKPAALRNLALRDPSGAARVEFPITNPITLDVSFECYEALPEATLSVIIYAHDRDMVLYSSESDIRGSLIVYEPGTYTASVTIPASLLNVGHYFFDVILHSPNVRMYAEVRDLRFEVTNIENPRSVVFQHYKHQGRIALPLSYHVEKHEHAA